jgi:hypothetical protein
MKHLFAAILTGAVLAAGAAQAVSVSAIATPNPATEGQEVTIDIVTSGDFPDFVGFEIAASFDNTILSFKSATFLPAFSGLSSIGTPTTLGSVTTIPDILGATFDPVLPFGEQTVLSLVFDAIGPGSTDVSFETVRSGFLDANNGSIFDQPFQTTVRVEAGSTVGGEIPLPATGLLLLGAIGALAARKRLAKS